MSLPSNIRQTLHNVGIEGLDGPIADELLCEASLFHSPRPLILHEVQVGDGVSLLCGVCRDNLTVLRHFVAAFAPEPVPWIVRREFGTRLRMLIGQ